MSRTPLVTFTSDFGLREYYVSAVKGALLQACPEARIVDITHQVASHDLLEGAFTIASAFSEFPKRTIHLVVVDPGVGSSRRALIVSTDHCYFVGPDNGVLSLIYQREEVQRVIAIDAAHHFRQPVSPTFHARDIFAPVVGKMAKGLAVDSFGSEIEDYVRLSVPKPKQVEGGQLEGIVLHIDKFGNVITNVTPTDLEAAGWRKPTGFSIGEHKIGEHVAFYSEASGNQPVSLLGSSGYYEIAVSRKPAARELGVRRGQKLRVVGSA